MTADPLTTDEQIQTAQTTMVAWLVLRQYDAAILMPYLVDSLADLIRDCDQNLPRAARRVVFFAGLRSLQRAGLPFAISSDRGQA